MRAPARILTGTVLVAFAAVAAQADDLSWVEKRVEELQPTRDERRIDQIGWVNNILQAERLAKANSRPVFLFTFDGPDMSRGRC